MNEVPVQASWVTWALLSAVFAALTAIFAKVGLEGIDSDFATLIRTVVIVLALGAFVAATGKWQGLAVVGGRSGLFLFFPRLRRAPRGSATTARSRSEKRPKLRP